MIIFSHIFIFTLLFGSFILMAEDNLKCPGTNLVSIKRPIGDSGKTFDYTFEFICKDQSLHSLIHIPGGPGQTSSGKRPHKDINANIIMTDPRGVGLNINYWMDGGLESEVSTEKIAEDINAIIKFLNLKNYSIYGHSFGTAVATIAASKLENEKELPLPKAVILEGTIGIANSIDKQQADSVKKGFENILKDDDGLSITCKLRRLQETLTSSEVGNLIEALLSVGNHLATSYLKKISNEELINISRNISDMRNDQDFMRVYNLIACQEFFKTGVIDTIYKEERLEFSEVGSCGQNSLLTNPFDSKAWQTSIKTYYIVGGADASTPPIQAYYHYTHQNHAKKEVLCIQDGGHSATSFNIKDCSSEIFNKMLKGESVALSITSCSAKILINSFECE